MSSLPATTPRGTERSAAARDHLWMPFTRHAPYERGEEVPLMNTSMYFAASGIDPNTTDDAEIAAGEEWMVANLAPNLEGFESNPGGSAIAQSTYALVQCWNGDARLGMDGSEEPDEWKFVYATPTANLWMDNWYSFGCEPGLFGTRANDVLSLDRYGEALGGSFLRTFWNTLRIGVVGTLIRLVVALPFAYRLAVKVPARWRGLLPALVLVPFSTALQAIGGGPLDVLHTRGTGRWRTFADVTLPLAFPGIASGCLLVFVPLTGDDVTATVLGGAKGNTAGQLVASQFQTAQNRALGSAMAVVLVLFTGGTVLVTAGVLLVVRRLVRNSRRVDLVGVAA